MLQRLRFVSFAILVVSATGAYQAGVFGSSLGDYQDFVAQCGGSQNIDELGVCAGFIAYCHWPVRRFTARLVSPKSRNQPRVQGSRASSLSW